MPRRALFVLIALTSAVRAEPSTVTFEQLNAAFGIPLWADENLWDDEDSAVGARLNWPEESRTPRDASFRRYAKADVRVLGARPYSLAFYGEENKPSRVSMVFANKGDVEGMTNVTDGQNGDVDAWREGKKAVKNFKKLLSEDAKTVVDALTAVLGAPKSDSFGQGRQGRESVQRWDWNGHAILVAAPRDEYLAVRVVPTDVADGVRKPRISDADLRAEIATRLDRRANGDVVIKEIPMVNQGPKGFCVPATWERAMRYMGIPADMYILAMAGNTGMGGGTSITNLVAGAKDMITLQGRRLDSLAISPTSRNVAKTIDKGLPIMWAMHVVPEVNKAATKRTAERQSVSDWKAWEKSLDPVRKSTRQIYCDPKSGHVCMIIGYNVETKEIAISDSWGNAFEERWITDEEALAITQRSLMVINF